VPTAAERALCRPWLDAELALVNPAVVVPVGRLAINLFYENRLSLTDIIGTSKRDGERTIVPLPHPSGASAWTNASENLALIEGALAILRDLKAELSL
jgi:uracil-DNA glycosylase